MTLWTVLLNTSSYYGLFVTTGLLIFRKCQVDSDLVAWQGVDVVNQKLESFCRRIAVQATYLSSITMPETYFDSDETLWKIYLISSFGL